MSFKSSGILTMTTYSGKTHMEMEQEYLAERSRRFAELMASEPVKEILKRCGDDLMAEYEAQHTKLWRGSAVTTTKLGESPSPVTQAEQQEKGK